MLYMVFHAGMNIPITRESIYHALAQNNTPSAIKKPSYEKSIFLCLTQVIHLDSFQHRIYSTFMSHSASIYLLGKI